MKLDDTSNDIDIERQKVYAYSKMTSIGLQNLKKYREPDIGTYLITKLNNELDKMDKKITKTWNLESNFYLTDADDRLYGKRSNLIDDSYYEANTLGEINNEEFLGELKEIIFEHIETNLENNNDLDKKTKEKVLIDANKQVEKLVDNFAQKYLNDKSRDMMANYQEKWDKAYENKDYDTANFFAGQIRRMYSRAIFKDDELREKNLRTIYIDDLLDEKRAKGEEIGLTRNRARSSR